MRIVIADDEEIMRLYLEDILPDLGHEVVASAQDGEELVELVEQTSPDLIITDIRMPRMDGIEAANRIYRKRSLPVVFISGFSLDHLSVPKPVVHVLLNKPVNMGDLDEGVKQAVDLFRSNIENA